MQRHDYLMREMGESDMWYPTLSDFSISITDWLEPVRGIRHKLLV